MSDKNYEYNKAVKINTIKELMDLAEKEDGSKIAFEYRNEKDKSKIETVTYKEFQYDTYYLGTALTQLGLNKEHIAVIGENSYKWLTVYLTVLKSDGVLVPIDRELPEKDIINILKSSDSEVLFYSEKYEKYIEDFKKELPNIKYFIGFDKEENFENDYKENVQRACNSLDNNNESDKPIFELFGIKLYSDDLIILAVLFLLYEQNVKDEMLYIILFLLLFS